MTSGIRMVYLEKIERNHLYRKTIYNFLYFKNNFRENYDKMEKSFQIKKITKVIKA